MQLIWNNFILTGESDDLDELQNARCSVRALGDATLKAFYDKLKGPVSKSSTDAKAILSF